MFAAIIPCIFLLWQNILIRDQNEKIQTQVDQQAADTLIVRRAQLLSILYEEECVTPKSTSNDVDSKTELCRPKSHLRAREEAALAFYKIERGQNVGPNLIGVNLKGGRFFQADFSQANLYQADFSNTNFYQARFFASYLRDANFQDAELGGADLLKADLNGANLVGAGLIGADMSFADMVGANLTGADLSEAILTQEQIDGANGDGTTKLPEGLTMPEHWKK